MKQNVRLTEWFIALANTWYKEQFDTCKVCCAEVGKFNLDTHMKWHREAGR